LFQCLIDLSVKEKGCNNCQQQNTTTNKWNMTIWDDDGQEGKVFKVKESDLLDPQFSIQQTHNGSSAAEQ
jgi:hypothetical protein